MDVQGETNEITQDQPVQMHFDKEWADDVHSLALLLCDATSSPCSI